LRTKSDSSVQAPQFRYATLRHKLIGEILLAADGDHLIRAIYIDCESGKKQKSWIHDPKHPVLRETAQQLSEYLHGKRKQFSVPLRLTGSDFQNRVYREVQSIPLGHITSYSELAKKMEMPGAARSVGAALGKNQLLIFIPDHRVISQSGAIGGFGGTWNRKPGLIELEERMAARTRKPSHKK
jgi:methylated-DNA-[protein]-cysteine S-methyltransferase